MAISYPTSLDSLTNPQPTDQMNVVSHADQHANANDAIEALEAKVGVTGVGFNPASSSAPASVVLHEDTDNGTNKITVTVPSAIGSDVVLTLPEATDTLVGKATTDTLTNKTLSTGSKIDANADGNITYYGMARQAIMNGNFDVWQRGTSVALADVTVSFQADRWQDYVDKNGGTLPTLTRSLQRTTLGDIANTLNFTRLATNGAGTSLGVSSIGFYRQRIEFGTRYLCGNGKKVTVSFYAKSDIANKRITPALQQNYGTGGSPTATEIIKGTPITLTSSWTKYTATFTTNTLVGKTFGSNYDDFLSLDFWYMWGTTTGNTYVQTGVTAETFVGAGNIDIAQVQLCSGDVALPFQPKSFEEELRACMRYFEKSFDYTIAPADNSGTNGVIANTLSATSSYPQVGKVQYSVRKRATVTPTLFNPSASNSNKIRNFNSGANIPGLIQSVGETGFQIIVNNTSTPANETVATHWTAEAEL